MHRSSDANVTCHRGMQMVSRPQAQQAWSMASRGPTRLHLAALGSPLFLPPPPTSALPSTSRRCLADQDMDTEPRQRFLPHPVVLIFLNTGVETTLRGDRVIQFPIPFRSWSLGRDCPQAPIRGNKRPKENRSLLLYCLCVF